MSTVVILFLVYSWLEGSFVVNDPVKRGQSSL